MRETENIFKNFNQDRSDWITDTRPNQYDQTPAVFTDKYCACGKLITGSFKTCYKCHKASEGKP